MTSMSSNKKQFAGLAKQQQQQSKQSAAELLAAADKEMGALIGAWGADDNEPVVDAAFHKWWITAQEEVWAKTADIRQAATDAERQAKEERAAESAEGVASLIGEWASEDYWWSKRCTCTEEDIDNNNGGGPIPVTCPCYKKVKLDENGEPQECRFFNSPAGCRDGADCVYQHKKRDPSTMPCRFELSPVGCNPGFGRKCPYMHTKEQTATETVLCRFDGRCKPPPGATCPYKHSANAGAGASWRSSGSSSSSSTAGNSWSRAGAAGGCSGSTAAAVRTGSKSDTPCSFGSRCKPRDGKSCPFKH